MADQIIISGTDRRYDGEYDFDIVEEPLTTLEWRWVKKISGYLPVTAQTGWAGQDPDLFLAFAIIALHRAGKIDKDDALRTAERLEDKPTSAISVVFEEVPVEDDENPEVASASESSKGGGEPSSPTSDPQGQDQRTTGHHGSPRSATSDRLTSVI